MELIDFIHRKDLLTKQECEEIIEIFEANDKYTFDGYIGGGIDTNCKRIFRFLMLLKK